MQIIVTKQRMMGEAGKDEWKNRFKKQIKKRTDLKTFKKKLLGLMDMIIILIFMMVGWMHAYVKMHQTVHFKYVEFILYQL